MHHHRLTRRITTVNRRITKAAVNSGGLEPPDWRTRSLQVNRRTNHQVSWRIRTWGDPASWVLADPSWIKSSSMEQSVIFLYQLSALEVTKDSFPQETRSPRPGVCAPGSGKTKAANKRTVP
ncbi:hypothetical protein NPIL_133531 [Nephila pilipes]|uniref:Uncharacterized protein n=1 Tax=Nephila pilipes TaxID=299642 RepID=A0A8X6MX60_NEPPI|nr:hypothetical protein NPIL_133531 [Nephila pilipes]